MVRQVTFSIGDAQHQIESAGLTRRSVLSGGLALVLVLCPRMGQAGPLDSIPLSRGAKILREGSVVVPGRTAGGPAGLAGSDVFSPARGWLSIDFAVQDQADLTLMILTQRQKAQVSSGQRLEGDPLARVAIEGPETANHSVVVGQDNYFVAFLNNEPRSITVIYRVSIKAF